jgi:hypothetical protein
MKLEISFPYATPEVGGSLEPGDKQERRPKWLITISLELLHVKG